MGDAMALPELAVMQQTYELLHQLDPHARRRVLKWVKDALDEADPVAVPAPAEPGDISVADEPAAAAAADIADEPAPALAPAVEAEAPAEDRNEATAGPAPAADRPRRRA